MQSYLDKINQSVNDFIQNLSKKKEMIESENLIKDFDIESIKNKNQEGSIVIPTRDILENEKTENKKDEAKKHFLDEIAEVNKKESEKIIIKTQLNNESRHIFRGAAYLFVAIFFIILSFLVFKYADKFMNSSVENNNQTFVIDNELVRADSSRVLSIEPGANVEAIKNILLQTIFNEEVKLDNLTIVSPSFLRESVLNGKKIFISEPMRGDEVFFTFAVSAPLSLRAMSSDRYALGVANLLGKNETFFAFSVTDKVGAVKEMLSYESNLYKDFKELMKLRDLAGEITFKDLSVNNHQLRVMSDEAGIVMLYGYGSDRNIIIAPNTDTFEKVFQRLK